MRQTTQVETGCPCIGLLHDADCSRARVVYKCPAPEHAPDCRIGHDRTVSCTEANAEAIRAARPSYGEFATVPAARGENSR